MKFKTFNEWYDYYSQQTLATILRNGIRELEEIESIDFLQLSHLLTCRIDAINTLLTQIKAVVEKNKTYLN